MTIPLRTQSFAGIVGALATIQQDVADAYLAESDRQIEVLGWRGQRAHVPPSAWIDMTPSAVRTGGGQVEDTLTFELWFTTTPEESEDSELTALVGLTDVALQVIDEALSRTGLDASLGVRFAERRSFAFRNTQTAITAGDPGSVQALVVTLAIRWTASVC